jgi:hypothetical protein
VTTIFCHWRWNFWLPLITKKNTYQELSKNILHVPFKIQLSTIEIFQLPILWQSKKGFNCHPMIRPSWMAIETHF